MQRVIAQCLDMEMVFLFVVVIVRPVVMIREDELRQNRADY